jgi:hypothetical protein
MTRTPTPGAAFAPYFVPTIEAAFSEPQRHKGERTRQRRPNGDRLCDAGPGNRPGDRLQRGPTERLRDLSSTVRFRRRAPVRP